MTEPQRRELHTLIVVVEEEPEIKFQRIADWVDSLEFEARKKALMEATKIVAEALFKFHTVANDHDFANVYKEVVSLLAKEGK